MILECDHCSAVVNAEVVAKYDGYDGESPPYRFTFAKCPQCERPFVAMQENYGDPNDERHWDDPRLLLPAPERAAWSLPSTVRNSLDEAYK